MAAGRAVSTGGYAAMCTSSCATTLLPAVFSTAWLTAPSAGSRALARPAASSAFTCWSICCLCSLRHSAPGSCRTGGRAGPRPGSHQPVTSGRRWQRFKQLGGRAGRLARRHLDCMALLAVLCTQFLWPLQFLLHRLGFGTDLQVFKLGLLVIHLGWLLLNLSAVAYFVTTTFRFVQQSARELLRERYTANVVQPRDITRRLRQQHYDLAMREPSAATGAGGRMPLAAVPRRWRSRRRSRNPRCCTMCVSPGCGGFSGGGRPAATKRRQGNPGTKGRCSGLRRTWTTRCGERSVGVGAVEGFRSPRLGDWCCATPSASGTPTMKRDFPTSDEILEELTDKAAAQLDRLAPVAFDDALREMVRYHRFLLALDASHTPDGAAFSFADVAGGARHAPHRGWIGQYRRLFERAADRLAEDDYFVRSLAYTPCRLLPGLGEPELPPDVVKAILDLGPMTAHRFEAWVTKRTTVETPKGQAAEPRLALAGSDARAYANVLPELVSAWESLLQRAPSMYGWSERGARGDAERWSAFRASWPFLWRHLSNTAYCLAVAVWNEDETGAALFREAVVRWPQALGRQLDGRAGLRHRCLLFPTFWSWIGRGRARRPCAARGCCGGGRAGLVARGARGQAAAPGVDTELLPGAGQGWRRARDGRTWRGWAAGALAHHGRGLPDTVADGCLALRSRGAPRQGALAQTLGVSPRPPGSATRST